MTRPSYDLVSGPLSGVQLVEASAGTGKTYTIAGVFVRLVVEAGLGVDQILVVTFTEAATEELRDRVRRRLRDAMKALADGGGAKDDPFLAGLVERTKDREAARRRLVHALRSFDQAAIFTIHGFCQRVLQEKAFECGEVFEAELATDETALLEECVADHWRRTLYDAPALFVRYLQARRITREHLTAFARRYAQAPGLVIVPEGGDPATEAAAERGVAGAYAAVQRLWLAERAAVVEILRHSPAIRRKAYQPGVVEAMISEMDGYVASGDPQANFSRFERFTSGYLSRRINKGFDPPDYGFFAACQALADSLSALDVAYAARAMRLQRECLDFVRRELPLRKARRNVRGFDDLLTGVRDALAGPVGDRLAAALGDRYRAALIDEFQDTDPVQYEIFRRVFAGPGARLFLIGDPKQAIYAFRGADVFTYLRAAAAADRQYTLCHNYRSTPDLLRAVNAVFERPDPFLFQRISYEAVTAGDPANKPPLTVGGAPDPAPLQLWLAERGEGKAINKGDAVRDLSRSVAAEVVRLLNGEGSGSGELGPVTRDGRNLLPGDVAVLVRTNRQARRVQEALVASGVPSVIYSAESLFASREAREVLRLVAALAEPGSEPRVAAALATSILGLMAGELERVRRDDRAWDRWLQAFHGVHAEWGRRGFVASIRRFLAEHGVRARLLAYVDGERRLTNVLHCVEVLQRAAVENQLGPEGLVAWLGRKIEEHDAAEEYQMRLETDERAVKVVTIHKAKGLEYPVVFCPFLWEGLGQAKDGEPVLFHDPADDRRLLLDLGSEDAPRHRELARREQLAERLRLAYVALTRARQRCYVAWGGYKDIHSSPLGYLLHATGKPEEAEAPEEILPRIENSLRGYTDEAMAADLEAVARRAGGAVAVTPPPEPAPRRYAGETPSPKGLVRAAPPARIDASWGLASFSGLTAGAPHEAQGETAGSEAPDRDPLRPAEAAGPEQAGGPAGSGGRTLAAFPPGTRTGICWHEVFEELDFQNPEAVPGVVRKRLARHGFAPEWEEAVGGMVHAVLEAPLLGPGEDFRLSRLPWEDRLVELEFHLPIGRLEPAGLAAAIRRHGSGEESRELADRVARLGFRTVRGLLKGFVDLVFRHRGRYHVLDWKSNRLGDGPADYASAALGRAMAEHHYDLQALLYTVALHRYLGRRLPGYDADAHLGGAVYVFLRGVDGDPGRGVHRWRPERSLVEGLDRALGGDGEL